MFQNQSLPELLSQAQKILEAKAHEMELRVQRRALAAS